MYRGISHGVVEWVLLLEILSKPEEEEGVLGYPDP
jgi:hypothetical protein